MVHWQKVRATFEGFEALLIDNPIDIFYLTGLDLSLGRLIITKKSARLFVDGRYLAKCKEAEGVAVSELSSKALAAFTKPIKRLGFDASYTSVAQLAHLKKVASCPLKPLSSPLQEIRAIKNHEEIALMQKAAKLGERGFKLIKKILRPGITEIEVANRFKIFCLEEGGSGCSFEPIIAFGKNSAYPHYRAGTTKLKNNQMVLVDIGVVVDHYCSDMTRMIPFGSPPKEHVLLDEINRKAQAAALELCKPGTPLAALDEAARSVMRSHGKEELFIHSLGHGLGLEVHEFPRVKSGGSDGKVLLKEGMVITIEPGLYEPGLGGVRYEDTIVITEKGYRNFYSTEVSRGSSS